MKFGLKWVHMARYELILRLDGALWLRIILKPLLTQKWLIKIKKVSKNPGWGRAGVTFNHLFSSCQSADFGMLSLLCYVFVSL